MSFESYRQLFDGYSQGRNLRAGGAGTEFEFDLSASPDKRYKLFVVGETGLFYQWKDEPDHPAHYRTISDALDTQNAFEAQYCLNLSSKKPEKYILRIYKKVMWPPVMSYLPMHPVPADWQTGVWARAEGLRFDEGGYLRMRIDIRLKKPGVNKHSVALAPDKTVIIDFAEGTWDWTRFARDVDIPPEETAHVGVWFEGANYSGKFFIERPFLTASSGQNMLPDFTMPVPDKEKFDWSAQYLSRKEWPEFRVTLNGEAIFEDEIFERCHLDSEWEIELPTRLLSGKNKLKIELISDYHDPLPYIVRELGVIEQPAGAISIVACTETANTIIGARVLMRTENDDVTARFISTDGKLSGEQEYHFAKAGLHGVTLKCEAACENARFEFAMGDFRVAGIIPRVAERRRDNVVTGTGDMIYIEQRMDYVEEYLSWYISNDIGNLLTIRPTYRWCGTRVLNPDVWEVVSRVLNELQIKYALMLDGRELPGLDSNPDDEMLRGQMYLGRQTHERDGSMYYWGDRGGNVSQMYEQIFDMEQRIFDENPKHSNPQYTYASYIYDGNAIDLFRDPKIPRDNRMGMECSVKALAETRLGAPRHTGPSVMFKYLLMAGYNWVGAETMYGSMEPLMAFLRGACLCCGQTNMGVHHAVQWSSSPQDAPEHFRRYRLALYVSYMQGATEINTEEGLWHLEEYYSHFHRFSAGCAGHREQQQDFFRYVTSHSRTGNFYAPMALLHGRYDGWHAFGHNNPWGWQGVKDSDAEKSWDLLKVFYPLSKPGDALYIHGCDTDHAVGYHTGTPMGNIDALPVESADVICRRYGALAFMGYNCARDEDFKKLRWYVENGGKLLLTRAHMTDTTLFEDIAAYRLNYSDNALGFVEGKPEFILSSVNGVALEVCVNATEPNEVLVRTDDGLPLVCRYAVGDGEVILVNANAYPAHPAIRAVYETEMEKLMRIQTEREYAWAETGDDVEFTVYDQLDGSRHIYLLAVDWFRPVEFERKATVRVGNWRYTARMPFGVMLKCAINGDHAAWANSESGEVLDITDEGARVQGSGRVTFTLAHDGKQADVDVDFGAECVRTLPFPD